MEPGESLATAERETRPSFAGMHGALINARRHDLERQGLGVDKINYTLRDVMAGDQTKFPGDIEFPINDLPDQSLAYLLTNTFQRDPYYGVLSREYERRIKLDPTLAKLKTDNLSPPEDILDHITYKAPAKSVK